MVVTRTGTRISGTAETGATVLIDINGDGTADATVRADQNGAWSFNPPAPIANGDTVSVTVVDAAGNTSQPIRVVIDTIAPATPTIDPSNGTSVTGRAEAGSTVLIDLNRDGTPDATATADADGRWTYTPATPLAAGTTVTVTARDTAGSVSGPATLALDLAAPAAPSLGAATDDVGSIQGAVAAGSVTNDTAPTFSGTAEAGATITLFDGDTQIGTTVAGANGAWSFAPVIPLGEGAHSVSFTATDGAGNRSGPRPASLSSSTPPRRVCLSSAPRTPPPLRAPVRRARRSRSTPMATARPMRTPLWAQMAPGAWRWRRRLPMAPW